MTVDDSVPPATTPRQEEILDHALALVREGGLSNLTTRRLAERVGFSEPALYRHFGGKQAVLLGLTYRLEAMLLGTVEDISSDVRQPALQRLRRILLFHVRLNQVNNSLPILLLAEASSSGDPKLMERMRTILARYLTYLERLVREAQEAGDVPAEPYTDCLALLALGLPAAFAIRHRLLPDKAFEARVLNNLIPFFVDGMLIERGTRRDKGEE